VAARGWSARARRRETPLHAALQRRSADTVTDVVITLGSPVRARPQYVLGTNEAGMRLAGATRAADAAVWSRAELGAYTGGLRKQPPGLAVEGCRDGRGRGRTFAPYEGALVPGRGSRRRLARPAAVARVVVLTDARETRHRRGERLPQHAALPEPSPAVDDMFRQIAG
jgi:hypothetical protein